jgi:serine/threonine protein kinase
MDSCDDLSSAAASEILSLYGIVDPAAQITVESLSSGLIHGTWKVSVPEDAYILQRMNTSVFKEPEAICNNISLLTNYVATKDPDYLLICPITATNGNFTVENNGSIYRLFPFVKKSVVFTVVESPEIAAAAAKSFGKLTAVLSEFDCASLHVPIANFHDLPLRYQQFQAALVKGNKERIARAGELVQYLHTQAHIVEAYCDMLYDPSFKLRVTHHDTKISNVLLDADDNSLALCVIDMDTVMPGYFISDVGGKFSEYLRYNCVLAYSHKCELTYCLCILYT